ncbi:MAG: hypothetical protein ACQETH_17185 [Candidatus Rifleibacteriota bacterium]
MLKKFFLFILIFLLPAILLAEEKLTIKLLTENKTIFLYLKNNTAKDIVIPANLRGCVVLWLLFTKNGELIPDRFWKLKSTMRDLNIPYSTHDCVFSIAANGHTYLASSIFSPKPSQVVADGKYYMLCIVRDVFDKKKKIQVSNIVGFHSKNNWIYSPYQVTRSEIPETVLQKIDAEIEKIKTEAPVSGNF